MQKRTLYTLLSAVLVAGLVGCTTMTGRSAGQNIDDATISASVKTNLAIERTRTLTAVDVDTVDGTVYLTGTAPNESAKERAGQIAEEVDGVRRVVNNLQTPARVAGDAPAEADLDDPDPGYEY